MPAWLIECPLFVAGYVLLDWISDFHALSPSGITPWNPQVGLALAAAVVRGPRIAWMLLPAVIIADLVVRFPRDSLLPGLGAALVIATTYTAGGLVLRHRAGADLMLVKLHEVVTLVLVAGVCGLTVALANSSWYHHLGLLDDRTATAGALSHWVGDTIGVLVFAPVLLCGRHLRWATALAAIRSTGAEITLQAGAMLLALWIAFGLDLTLDLKDDNALLYLLFLPIVWVSIRHGIVGVVVALLFLQVVIVLALEVQGASADRFTSLQILLLSVSVAGLLVGSAVSEREAATRALAESERKLAAIQETAPDGILGLDGAGTIVGANPAAERLFAMPASTLIGTRIGGLVHGPLSSTEGSCDVDIRLPNGEMRHIEVATASGTTDPPITTVVLRDVTERKVAEARLERLRMELAHASRLSLVGEMTSAIMHEVGQPIAALATYLSTGRQILAETCPTATEPLDIIDKAAQQVERSRVVLSRLREFLHRGHLELAPLMMETVVENALSLVRVDAKQRNITVRSHAEDGLPIVHGDHVHLEQVVLNLVRNAIEAIETARPARRQVVTSVRRDGAMIVVTVDDSGGGIDETIAKELFQPFTTTKATGMGLGLSICRTIIEAHGGRLGHQPSADGGCRFFFSLPIVST